MNKYRTLFLLWFATMLISSCKQRTVESERVEESSILQKELISQGWVRKEHEGGELDQSFGAESVYGLQDNYFDIRIGEGCSVAIKVVNASTDKCIRYVYIPKGHTVTINQIPQGFYYLKLAYGNEWMELSTDTLIHGKFSCSAFYERSASNYDFGRKNSQELVNYSLEINVIDGTLSHDFKTESISEEEFEKN